MAQGCTSDSHRRWAACRSRHRSGRALFPRPPPAESSRGRDPASGLAPASLVASRRPRPEPVVVAWSTRTPGFEPGVLVDVESWSVMARWRRRIPARLPLARQPSSRGDRRPDSLRCAAAGRDLRQSDLPSGATAVGAVVITGAEGCAVWTAAGIPNAPIAPDSAAASIRITDARRVGCACESMACQLSEHGVSPPLSAC